MKMLFILALFGAAAAQYAQGPECGGKQACVHLFEWKWKDIAEECERFLAPAGYCCVQVSPPTEHVILPDDNYPWWQRYQPASHRFYSRSGTEEEFINMVHRCNAVQVRIIVDAVVNHMTGLGRLGTGHGGSTYDGDAHDFPGVPFSREHFTPRDMCPSGDGNVNNYGDPNNVRNCYLVGLTDLYGSLPYVRQKITDYFNHMVEIGVAGVRIDAAKHMWPEDINVMLSGVNPLPTDQNFPPGSKFWVFTEVIDRNDGAIKVDEYYDMGLVTEFRYCSKIAWGARDFGQLGGLVDYGWGMARQDKAMVFTDNHDNQRGHGGAGDVVTHKDPRDYIFANAYMLAHPYGFPKVMSSYEFTNSDQGPPTSGGGSTNDVTINGDNSCGGGWICEHRWNAIYKMVSFRNAVHGTDIENYYNDGNLVGFSRGNKGFFAMVKSGSASMTMQTGMPAGSYCEIISGCATQITVGSDGNALIEINTDESIIAFCQGCNGDGPGVITRTPGPTTSTTSGPTLPPITEGNHRTVVFVFAQTNPGQDLFIRGGIDHLIRPGCVEDAETSECAIDISVNSLGTTEHYAKYNAWNTGETKLDWYGVQAGQGLYNGAPAEGTALAWTSKSSTDPGFQPLNVYGDHYWMVDTVMDCSDSEDGWFELKSYGTNGLGWETDVTQGGCTGTAGGSAPYTSTNHLAKCGYINVFKFGIPSCEINQFPIRE
ncbi:alpha-amylase 1-like [Artemia franciscana]